MSTKTTMTAKDVTIFLLQSLLAGFMIGIGGTASLLAGNLFGSAGKLIGACLFSLGIYAIIVFEMKLFTGMVAGIPRMKLRDTWQLPAVFIGNALGVALVALLVNFSTLAPIVIPQGAAVIAPKLDAAAYALKSFCSAILCGFLITISVWGPKFAPQKNLGAAVIVLMPIVVFAFCGFDHSVANMMYFYCLGEISPRVVLYILASVAGNVVGGVLLPLVALLKEKSVTDKA